METLIINQCDQTGKKCHQTEAAAVRFEIDNRQRFKDSAQQYPYLCEDCGFHHLSALPAGEPTRARVNYDEASKYVVRTRRTAEEQAELFEQIMQLTRDGKSAQQIADELKITLQTVYNLRNGKLSGSLNNTVQGIEIKKLSIQEQIAKLQADLESEERRKQQLIEARQLRVQWSEIPGGEYVLVITKDLERFTILPEDATKLIKLLEQAFASGPARAAA